MQIINLRPIVVPAGHAILLQKVFDFHLTATCFIFHSGVKFCNFYRNTLMLIGCVVQMYTMEPGVKNIAYSSL